MPWLHCLPPSILCPYDVQITVSVRPPQGDLATIRTDLGASWSLRFCLTLHNDKLKKLKARSHIAVTSYDPRTGTAR